MRRREDAQWVREHLGPWVAAGCAGRSSGDGLDPKRPDLSIFLAAAAGGRAFVVV